MGLGGCRLYLLNTKLFPERYWRGPRSQEVGGWCAVGERTAPRAIHCQRQKRTPALKERYPSQAKLLERLEKVKRTHVSAINVLLRLNNCFVDSISIL